MSGPASETRYKRLLIVPRAATVVSDLQCVSGPTCKAAEPVGVIKRISQLFQSTSPIRASINWLMSAARVNGFGAECKLVEEEEV